VRKRVRCATGAGGTTVDSSGMDAATRCGQVWLDVAGGNVAAAGDATVKDEVETGVKTGVETGAGTTLGGCGGLGKGVPRRLCIQCILCCRKWCSLVVV
jgi:hypothetical protein